MAPLTHMPPILARMVSMAPTAPMLPLVALAHLAHMAHMASMAHLGLPRSLDARKRSADSFAYETSMR